MFEALFDRRLQPKGAFAEALRLAGYDAARTSVTYPTEVWVACLEIARQHVWPDLSKPEAYRHIGREFAEGFLTTLGGRMVGAAMAFMTPQSFVRRLANYLRMGRNDSALTFDLVRDEVGAIDAKVHNPAAVPGGFIAGMIDAAYARLKANWTIEVLQHTPTDYELMIRWKP
jgi:uncharacterized protein (TIGR02265 family)